MNPKEKADYLYFSFRMLQVANDDVDDETFNPESRAKKCAENCVIQILEVCRLYNHRVLLYWEEVKQEIEKL